MKLKLFIAMFAAAALMAGTVGCDEKKADDEKEASKDDDEKKADEEKEDEGDTKEAKDEGDGDLPEACTKYIEKTEACLEGIDQPAAKSAMEQGLKAQREAFDKASTPEAKEALTSGCEQALKGIEDNPACK